MQDKHIFEYAIIRVVPRVEREEFINVGVILYCSKLNFLQVKYTLNAPRLHCFPERPDMQELHEHLALFKKICAGSKQGGPIALLDTPSRFRWLTATRSTVVQCSSVHPGFSTDPDETLAKLHRQLVL